MAFLSLSAPQVIKRPNYAFAMKCSRHDYRKSSSVLPFFSAAVAAVISLPLVTGEREGPQPLYRKLAPASATAVVAASLLLRRRQKSSRTVVPKQSPDIESAETATHDDRQDIELDTSRRNSSIYNGSREDWSSSKTQYEANRSSPETQGSYQGQSYFETHNRTLEEKDNNKTTGKQSAVGMNTASLFAHMRAEFDSEPSSDQHNRPQRSNVHKDDEQLHASLARPPAANLSGKDKSSVSGLQHPSSVSAPDVLRWFIRAPVFILSDIIVPIAQVSSILWYDGKQWMLGLRNKEEIPFFMDDIHTTTQHFNSFENNSGTPWDWDDLDVELTDEEKLLNEVQGNMRTVLGHAYGTIRRFFT